MTYPRSHRAHGLGSCCCSWNSRHITPPPTHTAGFVPAARRGVPPSVLGGQALGAFWQTRLRPSPCAVRGAPTSDRAAWPLSAVFPVGVPRPLWVVSSLGRLCSEPGLPWKVVQAVSSMRAPGHGGARGCRRPGSAQGLGVDGVGGSQSCVEDNSPGGAGRRRCPASAPPTRPPESVHSFICLSPCVHSPFVSLGRFIATALPFLFLPCRLLSSSGQLCQVSAVNVFCLFRS